MIVPCPHCQTRLNLPENAGGKQVRCPSCREVFRADKGALAQAVQAEPPPPLPADDAIEERSPRSRPPRYEGYGEDEEGDEPRRDDDEFDRRDVERDAENVIDNAKAQTRLAAYMMLAAFAFTTLNILGNSVVNVLTQMEMGNMQGDMAPFMAIGVVCGVLFYAVPLGFMMFAGRGLLILGSRGIIITAIVMNFLMMLLLGGGALLNVGVMVVMELPVPLGLTVPVIVMNSISSVLNLTAAVMAIRALRLPDVVEAYALRAEQAMRRRRRW